MYKKIVVGSDIHFPHQDKKAVKSFLVFIKEYKPDVIVLNGDVVDFFDLSRFDKDPARVNCLQKELNQAITFLTNLRSIAGDNTKIFYNEGNHEERLTKYIYKNSEISSLDNLKIENLLHLDRVDVKYGKRCKVGPLLFTHGGVVRKFSGYSAHAELDKYNVSGASGHTHRLGSCYRSGYTNPIEWHESGCLCSLDVFYLKDEPNWQQGFLAGVYSGEMFNLYPIKIQLDGSVLNPFK